MSRRSDVIGGVLGAAIFLGAIVLVVMQRGGRSGDDEPAVAGTREAVVASEVVDERLRFRLRAPDKTWRVFGRTDAEREELESHAMMLDAETLLDVRIDRIGEITQEQAAAQVARWTGAPASSQRSVSWLDRDCTELTYTDLGDIRRERAFVRDGWLYRITVSRTTERGEASNEEYARIFAAFTLLPGKVMPPIQAPVHHDPRGVDWRVAGNRWDSAAAMLSIAPPPGWRIVAGGALHLFRRDVDVMLSSAALGCYVTIAASASPVEAEVDDVVMTAEVAGEPRQFVATGEDDPIFQYWDTSLERGGGVVQVRGWCPRADGDASIAELRRTFAAIQAIPEPEGAALASALDAEQLTPGELGADCAYRAGMFVHYRAGLIWREPSLGLWQVAPCERATQWFEEAILVVELPSLSMAVVPDATITERGPQRWLDENMPTATRPVDLSGTNPALLPGVEAVWKEGKVETFVHRVVSLVGDQKFRVHVYGPVERVRALDAEIRAMLAGLEARSVETPREPGNSFEDVRAGFAVDLPGWARTDHAVGPAVVDRSWRAQDRLAGVLVENGRRDHAISRTRSRRRASAIPILPRAIETEDELDGVPAIRLGWREQREHVTVFLAEKHDTLYTVWARGDARTAETVRQAFRFVDEPY